MTQPAVTLTFELADWQVARILESLTYVDDAVAGPQFAALNYVRWALEAATSGGDA